MTYQEYVLDVFTEHHVSGGVDLEEVKDIVNETEFSKIEKWLQKIGYDLNEYYMR